jgi:two-component system, LuxR family, response regulator FixJ
VKQNCQRFFTAVDRCKSSDPRCPGLLQERLGGNTLTSSAESFVGPRAAGNETVAETGGRLAVVEDDARMRQALSFQLGTAGFRVATYSSAEKFLEALAAMEVDCIVADIYLPRMNGLKLQEELNRTVPYASIVFITGHGDLSLGMHAMRKGAVDFLEKPLDDEALLSAIARGTDLSRKRRAERVQRIELEKRQSTLTPREGEVFLLITAGLLNKQVGAELGATERTIKAHRGQVMNKMHANSLADLVRMAGILQIHAARTQPSQAR